MKNRLLAGMLITALAVQTAIPFEMGMVYAEEKENIVVENENAETMGTETKVNISGYNDSTNIKYTLNTDGVLVLSPKDPSRDATVKGFFDGYGASQRFYITKIIMESGITEISNYAFGDMDFEVNGKYITDVEFPDTLKTIGAYAFDGCSSLKSVNFPASVEYIDGFAFANCTSLTEVTLPTSNTYGQVFENCTGLKKVTFPKTAFPNGAWNSAFKGCKNLETVDLGGATEIPYCGFMSCTSLKEITIPNTVKTIGEGAFVDTSLKNVVIPEGVQKIGGQAFEECTKLESLSFPSTATDIDFESVLCHRSCNLKSISVAKNNPVYDSRNNCNAVIRKSDNMLVLGCIGTMEIPEGVKGIMDHAFCGAYPSSIVIPNSVTYFSSLPFDTIYCRSDSYVYTFKDLPYNNYSSINFILLDSNTKPNNNQNNNNNNDNSNKNNNNKNNNTTTNSNKNNNPNNNSQSNTVKKGTTIRVKDNKYKVTGKNTVTFTGLKNSKVKKVTVPNTVKYKGKTYKVTAVAGKALKGKNVTRVKIGDNVKTIGTSAMENCKKLTSVTLGKNVNKIGKYAFKSDKKLKTVTIKSKKLKSVGKNAFKGIHSNAKMKVPSNKKSAYKKLMKGAGLGKKVKIVKG